MRFQWEMVLSVQKKAMTVCSGVRDEPVARPRLFTSSKSLAYAALSSAGGPSGRK